MTLSTQDIYPDSPVILAPSDLSSDDVVVDSILLTSEDEYVRAFMESYAIADKTVFQSITDLRTLIITIARNLANIDIKLNEVHSWGVIEDSAVQRDAIRHYSGNVLSLSQQLSSNIKAINRQVNGGTY